MVTGISVEEEKASRRNTVLPAPTNTVDAKVLYLRWNPGPLGYSAGLLQILIPTDCRM